MQTGANVHLLRVLQAQNKYKTFKLIGRHLIDLEILTQLIHRCCVRRVILCLLLGHLQPLPASAFGFRLLKQLLEDLHGLRKLLVLGQSGQNIMTISLMSH